MLSFLKIWSSSSYWNNKDIISNCYSLRQLNNTYSITMVQTKKAWCVVHQALGIRKKRGSDLLSRVSSTIGAEELNGRVRDGNGCGLLAVTTSKICWSRLFGFIIPFRTLGGTIDGRSQKKEGWAGRKHTCSNDVAMTPAKLPVVLVYVLCNFMCCIPMGCALRIIPNAGRSNRPL